MKNYCKKIICFLKYWELRQTVLEFSIETLSFKVILS